MLDTRGVNVWCAAGKGTFSTAEILFSLERYNLAELVSHQKLIVPQLAATAVNGREVYSKSGFRVQFGPIRTCDIEMYLQNTNIADEEMRMVSFSLSERAVLIPVEIFLLLKPLVIVFILAFIFSGISSSIFSVEMMTKRGFVLFTSTLFGILAGAVVTPILLPWLPSRQFWIKGLLPGILAWGCCLGIFYKTVNLYEVVALFLWVSAVSSYLAMNFTGSTPFTSPSGVEYEMKRGLIYQVVTSLFAVGIWISGAFI